MRSEDREKVLKEFFLDHAKMLQLQIQDINEWLDNKYYGEFSDHHNRYEFLRYVKIFLNHKIKKIYSINEEKISNFLKERDEKLLKEWKEKRGLK